MSTTLKERAAAFAALPKNDGGIVDDMLVEFANRELETLTRKVAEGIDKAEVALKGEPKAKRARPTIAELDAILKDPNPGDVEILPNGEVVVNAELTRLRAEVAELRTQRQPINVVFDGPPGPEGPRFVEVETDDRKSIGIGAMQIGAWYERGDGYWAIRFTELPKAGAS